MNHYRRIFKNQQTGTAITRELLQSMFVGEMLETGNRIWIVSPWIRNIILIDNRTGNFDTLSPEWGRKEVRMIDVLIGLMTKGTEVVLVTRDVEDNRSFLNALRYAVSEHGVTENLRITYDPNLHTKGVLLSRSLLTGSMNLTYYGLEINDEWIQFTIDPDDIATTRLEFERYVNNHE